MYDHPSEFNWGGGRGFKEPEQNLIRQLNT